MANRDYSVLLATLSALRVRYLVVGAYAVSFHGRPRSTEDLNLWIEATPENVALAWQALAAFGAPLRSQGITERDLARPGSVHQFGVAPNRIDIRTAVAGLEFAACYARRVMSTLDGVPIAYLGREKLIANKKAVGRPQDLADVRELERS
jgi:hypothetical protein